MPLLKIFIDDTIPSAIRNDLTASLPEVRTLLCNLLQADPTACAFMIVPMLAYEGGTPVAAELNILPHPTRTQEVVRLAATALQNMLNDAAGMHTWVRVTQMDPDRYFALR